MGKLALGMMSGTSMDGMDLAVIDVNTQALVASETLAYSNNLSKKLQKVMAGKAFDAQYFAQLHREVGLEFAYSAQQLLKRLPGNLQQQVKVVGFHGQTICHDTTNVLPYTWQIGCPYAIRELCQLPVVFDFRSKNIAQGGQGAPLAPLYHQQLFPKHDALAVVNIGGISNLSLLQQDCPPLGFDLGPGNCLLDAWICANLQLPFDADGHWAASGKINQDLLLQLLQDDFVNQSYPKSVGKEYYSLSWLQAQIGRYSLPAVDVQATLTAFTAAAIAQQVKARLPSHHPVLICGGGAKNHYLLQLLQQRLPHHPVQTTTELGFAADYIEAMMIAWLAWTRIEGIRHHLGLIMGGQDDELLGIICE